MYIYLHFYRSFYSLFVLVSIPMMTELFIKMIQILGFWHFNIVLRFLTDNENIIYINLKRGTIKLEKISLSYNDMLPTYKNMLFSSCYYSELKHYNSAVLKSSATTSIECNYPKLCSHINNSINLIESIQQRSMTCWTCT